MTKENFRIGDRVHPYGAPDIGGAVIGVGAVAFGAPMVQVKFDRADLNYGCDGPQAGQWLEESTVTVSARGAL